MMVIVVGRLDDHVMVICHTSAIPGHTKSLQSCHMYQYNYDVHVNVFSLTVIFFVLLVIFYYVPRSLTVGTLCFSGLSVRPSRFDGYL